MKRLSIIFLILCLCLSACSGKEDTTTEPTEAEEHTFVAVVTDKDGDIVRVEPVSGENISFVEGMINMADLQSGDVDRGDVVLVTYKGDIEGAYPTDIDVSALVVLDNDLRDYEYTGRWMEEERAQFYKDEGKLDGVVISRIFADCFFVRGVLFPTEYKLNGKLGDEWCVGDTVCCYYENCYYYDNRYEADFVRAAETDKPTSRGDDFPYVYKPVIYLYPEEQTEVSVSLTLKGELTCTYPKYNDGWTVSAAPDGTLTDENGKTYNYLYWEGQTDAEYDFSHGFCVKGEDTAVFLESALEKLGLNRREANEFIVYWLPLMEVNPYNVISFQGEVYTDAADLTVTPTPDTLIRVFMAWKRSDEAVDIPAQSLCAPKREGFTVIEWGGTKVK